jgi:hypothetical protein
MQRVPRSSGGAEPQPLCEKERRGKSLQKEEDGMKYEIAMKPGEKLEVEGEPCEIGIPGQFGVHLRDNLWFVSELTTGFFVAFSTVSKHDAIESAKRLAIYHGPDGFRQAINKAHVQFKGEAA